MKSIVPLIIKTHTAATALRNAGDKNIKAALKQLATEIRVQAALLVKANQLDIEKMTLGDPKIDRLLLDEKRINTIALGLKQVSMLPNPSGKILEQRTLPNGLKLEKQSVPLGVVAAIYESRPNVTFDIAALCLRSMNGCILKGSSEAHFTNVTALKIIKKVLKQNGLPQDCVTLLPPERETVQELLTATRYVDVVIPRGSDALIKYVRSNSLVPVIETGAGVCHVYVEKDADLDKALDIVVNAKVSRPSVCNSMDTLIVDETIAPELLERLKQRFGEHGVAVFADVKAARIMKGYTLLHKASKNDYDREFLSLQCAIKTVKGIDEALKHIAQHSTRHSEAIVSKNKQQCERFMKEVDAAAVYTNASTRFTDGMEFGLGAEIGISTQKLHARGPFALEKLVTEKWLIRGDGQVR